MLFLLSPVCLLRVGLAAGLHKNLLNRFSRNLDGGMCLSRELTPLTFSVDPGIFLTFSTLPDGELFNIFVDFSVSDGRILMILTVGSWRRYALY